MRKTVAMMLSLTLLLSLLCGLPVQAALSGVDVTLASITDLTGTSITDTNAGDSMRVSINLENNTSAAKALTVRLAENGAFSFVGGVSSVSAGTVASYGNATIALDLVYNGRSRYLELIVSDGSDVAHVSLLIPTAVVDNGEVLTLVHYSVRNKQSASEPIYMGDTATVRLSLGNSGSQPISGKIALDAAGGFSLAAGSAAPAFSIAANATSEVSFDVVLSGKTTDLILNLEHDGRTAQKTIPVSNAVLENRPSEVEIRASQTVPTVKPGTVNAKSFTLELLSYGDVPAFNLSVTLSAGDAVSKMIIDANEEIMLTRYCDALAKNSPAELDYYLNIPDTLPSGPCVFHVTVQYYYGIDFVRDSVTLQFPVLIENQKLPTVTPTPAVVPVGPLPEVMEVTFAPEKPVAGQPFEMKVTVKNNGDSRVSNLEVSLPKLSAAGLTAETAALSLGSLTPGGSASAVFRLIAPANAGSRQIPLQLLLRYHSIGGAVKESSFESSVELEGQRPAELVISQSSTDRQSYEKGASGVGTLVLTNSGAGAASNVQIKFEGFSSEGVFLKSGVEGNSASRSLGTVAPGSSVSALFYFDVAQNLPTGGVTIRGTVTYTNPDETQTTMYADFRINTTSAGSGNLLDYTYAVEGEAVAGAEFTLNLNLTNVSPSASVSNIRLSFSSPDGTIYAADGKSTVSVKSLAAGASQMISLKLLTDSEQEEGLYPILINLAYEDSQNRIYSEEDSINLRIWQMQSISFELKNSGEKLIFGEPISLVLHYENTGKAPLYHFTVRTEGHKAVEDTSVVIGDISPGESGNFGLAITAEEPGLIEGEMVLEYENAIGNITEHRLPFSLLVEEGEDIVIVTDPTIVPTQPQMPEEEPVQDLHLNVAFVVIVCVLLGIILISYLGVMRQKQNGEEESEEPAQGENASASANQKTWDMFEAEYQRRKAEEKALRDAEAKVDRELSGKKQK